MAGILSALLPMPKVPMVPSSSAWRRCRRVSSCEVGGGGFVEEPEVDVAGAEGGEAAVEGGFGLGGGEGGAVVVACGGVGCLARRCLRLGSCFERGPARRRPLG